MKHFKILLLLLMSIIISPVCNATNGNVTILYSQERLDSIVNKEVQKQIDTALWALKIDKIANEKLDRIQAEHDAQISHMLTLIALIFTVLTAIIGILVPLLSNRNIESKIGENTKELEKSKKELEKNEERLNEQEKIISGIRDDVERFKREADISKKAAEEAARKSKFSELLSQVWNEKEFGKKIELVSQLIEEYRDDVFASKSYYTRGTFYLDNKSFDNALADFTEAIKRNPDDATLYCIRGNVYRKLSQKDNAIADYTKAIEMNSKYAEAYYGRGNSFIPEDLTKAIEDLKKAINISPDFLKAYYLLGRVFEMEENYAQALDILDNGYKQAKFQDDLNMRSILSKEIDRVKKIKANPNRTQEGESSLSRFV